MTTLTLSGSGGNSKTSFGERAPARTGSRRQTPVRASQKATLSLQAGGAQQGATSRRRRLQEALASGLVGLPVGATEKM